MSAVIQAGGLGKRYRRTWALRDCTLAIPEGRVVGLVGPNGAGKTTLLRRRQPVARLQHPQAQGLMNLLHELQVGGDARGLVELELDHEFLISLRA